MVTGFTWGFRCFRGVRRVQRRLDGFRGGLQGLEVFCRGAQGFRGI